GDPDRANPGDVREPAVHEHRPELRPERKLGDLRDLEPERRDAFLDGHRARTIGWAVGGFAGRGGGFESTRTAAASSTAIATVLSPARLRGRRVRIPPSPRASA